MIEKLFEQEERSWWHLGMRAAFEAFLGSPDGRHGTARVLDAGCGTGGHGQWLKRYGRVVGLEADPEVFALAKRRSWSGLVRGVVEHLPFGQGSFDLVALINVMECVLDPGVVLAEAYRVCRRNGRILLLTTAHPWLYSQHDLAVGAHRRYRLCDVRSLVERAGLRPVRLSYVNSLLLPAFVLIRKMKPVVPGARAESDFQFLTSPLSAGLRWLLRAEAGWLRYANLPWGVGISCVADKP